MIEEQKRFFDLLSRFPAISGFFWRNGKPELDIEGLQAALSSMSPEHQHMARFFGDLWLGSSHRFGFDLIQAAQVLDSDDIAVITGWMASPFWP